MASGSTYEDQLLRLTTQNQPGGTKAPAYPTPQGVTTPPPAPTAAKGPDYGDPTPPPPTPAPAPAPTPTPTPPPAPKSVTDFDWSNYQDAKSAVMGALNSGIQWSSPETVVDSVNNYFHLPAGQSVAWRAIPGAPGGGVYGIPSGGYIALGPDGKWGWNPGDSGGGSTTDRKTGAYVPGQGAAGMGTVLPNPDATALFDLLMGRAKQSLNVNPNDPIIRNQTDAFNASEQQAERDYLSNLAETRGPNASMGVERRAASEKVGQQTSAFEANLISSEITARRAEIQSALTGAQGLLTAEQQMMLQEELAQLDLAERAYEFDKNDQFRNSPLYGG